MLQLDVVEKGLNDFLETKKMAFPRYLQHHRILARWALHAGLLLKCALLMSCSMVQQPDWLLLSITSIDCPQPLKVSRLRTAVCLRFYFLPNDELLEILSEAKDPLAVQPFVKKCFEAVKELVFEPNGEITGMISQEGEKITFVERVNPATTGTCFPPPAVA